MVCRKCKQNRAHRVERVGAIDNTANRFFLKPYSCDACRHRFYVMRQDVSVVAIRMEVGERLANVWSRKKGRRTRREMYIYVLAGVVIAAMIYFLAQQRS